MAAFLSSLTHRMEYLPVEAWDEKGMPYVANELGLDTVTDYAETQSCSFSTLMTAQMHRDELAQERKDAQRVRSRMSIKELQAAGMSTMRDDDLYELGSDS